jgi:PAS domain-containing protein
MEGEAQQMAAPHAMDGTVCFNSSSDDTRMDSMWAAFDDFDNLDQAFGAAADADGVLQSSFDQEMDFDKLIAKASPSPAGSLRRDLSTPAEHAYRPSRGMLPVAPFQIPLSLAHHGSSGLPPRAGASALVRGSAASGGAAASSAAGAAKSAQQGGCLSRDLEQAVEAQLPQLPDALGKRPRTADPAQRLQRSRERKCFHAKRSRLRKKFFLQSLQTLRADMERRNLALAQAVRSHLTPEVAERVLEAAKQATGKERPDQGPGSAIAAAAAAADAAAAAADGATAGLSAAAASAAASTAGLSGAGDEGKNNTSFMTALDTCDSALVHSIASSMQNFVITNPRAPDNPIIFASEQFYALTQFAPSEVIGFNCRFLQGPGTDPRAIQLIRDGLQRGEDISVCLLNYRKDGSPFFNQFFLAPLRGQSGEVENYVGVQAPVSEAHFHKVCEKQFEMADVRRKAREAGESSAEAPVAAAATSLRPDQIAAALPVTAVAAAIAAVAASAASAAAAAAAAPAPAPAPAAEAEAGAATTSASSGGSVAPVKTTAGNSSGGISDGGSGVRKSGRMRRSTVVAAH